LRAGFFASPIFCPSILLLAKSFAFGKEFIVQKGICPVTELDWHP
jgi:hypothetical protein